MFNKGFYVEFYEPCRDSALAQTYREIREHLLAEYGVTVSVSHVFDATSRRKLYVLQEEPPTYPIESRYRRIYGARLLNRLERLLIAQECGCYVATFKSAMCSEQCNIDYEWVWKRDFSSGGVGVTECRPPLNSENVTEGDVLMQLIDRAGKTWKLDCLFDVPIACRVLTYNPLLARGSEDREEQIAIPPELIHVPAYLGPRLAASGCIYYSVDFMRLQERFAIIELNTSGVGRLDQWVTQRPIFAKKVCAGLVNFLKSDCSKTTLGSVVARLSVWRNKMAVSQG